MIHGIMHREIMERRFPHFVDLFFYNTQGCITKIRHNFTWKGYDAATIFDYILSISHRVERKNVGDEFIRCISKI